MLESNNNSIKDQANNANLISSIKDNKIALIKTWNISLNTNALCFLKKFTRHLHHLHLWLFTDLPFATEDKHPVWGTTLNGFIRTLRLCEVNEMQNTIQLRNHCRLFSRQIDVNNPNDNKDMEALKKQVKKIATQLNVIPYLFEESVDTTGTRFISKMAETFSLKPDHHLISVPLSMFFL